MERLTYVKSRNRWDNGKHPTKYTSRHTFQEVVARLAAYEETGLEPGEIANWIYSSTNPPDSEFEKTIRAVENALGFKLFVWQKTFIEDERFRQMGDTTARILRDLLDVSAKPIDYTRGAATHRQQFYRRELQEIKGKLDRAGIPTRTVFFSESDKRKEG